MLAVGLVQILVILDECSVSPVKSMGPARRSVRGADAHSEHLLAKALGGLGLLNPAAGAAFDLPRTPQGLRGTGLGAGRRPGQVLMSRCVMGQCQPLHCQRGAAVPPAPDPAAVPLRLAWQKKGNDRQLWGSPTSGD